MSAPIQTPRGGRRPQLNHSARKMIEARIAKYDDPHNEEWDLGDPHIHKWEHHAISIYRDLLAAEAEIERLSAHVKDLDHDVQAAVDEANWQNRQGDEYGSY